MKLTLLTLFLALAVCTTTVKSQDISIEAPDPSAIDNDVIYANAESMASFPGGIEGFNTYIAKNIRYPQADVQGRVTVNFIVEKDGSLSNFRILRGLTDECNTEALRLLKAAPKFIPGKHQGELVRCSVSMAVPFKLQDK